VSHVPAPVLRAYATDPVAVPDAVAWTVEAHLEICAECRARLAAAVPPSTGDLLARVRSNLEPELAARTSARWRLGTGWFAPVLLPRVLVTVGVLASALGLDLLDAALRDDLPSLVLLVAPAAPLAGVAAAWSRAWDPMYELTASSPRASLDLVLRRTLVALLLVLPVLAVAGWVAGASPAVWLLPGLALTAGALALGPHVGLERAALLLGGAWVALAVGQGVVLRTVPAALDPAFAPAWIAALSVLSALLYFRRRDFERAPQR
jgi:hypothetical protein